MITLKMSLTGEDCHKKGLQALDNGNYIKAFDYFSQGYSKFYGPCLLELGKMYRQGEYVSMDQQKAMFFFKRGAYKYNEASCHFILGEIYCLETEKQGPEVIRILNHIDSLASEKNTTNYTRYWLIGEMHRLGLGHEKSCKQAVDWYQRAMDAFELKSHHNPKLERISFKETYATMGTIYKEGGFGVDQDYTKALQFYKKAALENHSPVYNKLGDMYKHGLGVPVDHKEAFKWYFKAADGADHSAEICTLGQFNLGLMYRHGLGTKMDSDNAMFWFKKATYGGNREAGDYMEQMQRNKLSASSREKLAQEEQKSITHKHEARLTEIEYSIRATEKKIEVLMTHFEKI